MCEITKRFLSRTELTITFFYSNFPVECQQQIKAFLMMRAFHITCHLDTHKTSLFDTQKSFTSARKLPHVRAPEFLSRGDSEI